MKQLLQKSNKRIDTHIEEEKRQEQLLQIQEKMKILKQLQDIPNKSQEQIKYLEDQQKLLNDQLNLFQTRYNINYVDLLSKISSNLLEDQILQAKERQQKRQDEASIHEDVFDLVDENNLLIERINNVNKINPALQPYLNNLNRLSKGLQPLEISEQERDDIKHYLKLSNEEEIPSKLYKIPIVLKNYQGLQPYQMRNVYKEHIQKQNEQFQQQQEQKQNIARKISKILGLQKADKFRQQQQQKQVIQGLQQNTQEQKAKKKYKQVVEEYKHKQQQDKEQAEKQSRKQDLQNREQYFKEEKQKKQAKKVVSSLKQNKEENEQKLAKKMHNIIQKGLEEEKQINQPTTEQLIKDKPQEEEKSSEGSLDTAIFTENIDISESDIDYEQQQQIVKTLQQSLSDLSKIKVIKRKTETVDSKQAFDETTIQDIMKIYDQSVYQYMSPNIRESQRQEYLQNLKTYNKNISQNQKIQLLKSTINGILQKYKKQKQNV